MEGKPPTRRPGHERFAIWRGYTPSRSASDGSRLPLTAPELRSEAARFIAEVDRCQREGDLLSAQRFRRAAAIFRWRAAGLERGSQRIDLEGTAQARPPADGGRAEALPKRVQAR